MSPTNIKQYISTIILGEGGGACEIREHKTVELITNNYDEFKNGKIKIKEVATWFCCWKNRIQPLEGVQKRSAKFVREGLGHGFVLIVNVAEITGNQSFSLQAKAWDVISSKIQKECLGNVPARNKFPLNLRN